MLWHVLVIFCAACLCSYYMPFSSDVPRLHTQRGPMLVYNRVFDGKSACMILLRRSSNQHSDLIYWASFQCQLKWWPSIREGAACYGLCIL